MSDERTAPDIRARIDDVTGMIERFGDAMEAGESVDLRPLEAKVSELHELVARKPADSAGMGATSLIDSFTAILRGLDRLEAELTARQARIAGAAYGGRTPRND